jgi:acyl-CoA synthetase (AMP-forming)/AMP-acid ligase II
VPPEAIMTDDANGASARLVTHGLLGPDAGEVVGVVAESSHEFVEAILACQRDGAVSVPLRRADDRERVSAAGVTRVVRPGKTTGFFRPKVTLGGSARVAQVLFTSGTTGEARGILLSEANVAGTTKRLADVMALDGSVREYVGVPVYYSFGMGRVRAVGSVGGECFLPATGFDPSELGALLARGEINAISAVPTLWRLLLQNRELIAAHGARVRWIEIGSQLMLRAEKEALKGLFPEAVIVQHYGLTEASRSTFLEIHRVEGRALDSVGSARPPVELRLAPDGRVMIRGPHVARQRLGAHGLEPMTDAEGWLTTNDLGSLEDGYLHFRGRADDLVNCGGIKIVPDTFEAALFAELGVQGGVAVGRLPDAMRGESLLVAFEEKSGLDSERVKRAALAAAEGYGLKAAGAITVRRVAALPRTDTGKVRRAALAEQAEMGGASTAAGASAPAGPTPAPEDAASVEARLLGIWRETLGIEELTTSDSFYDLGGDSLTAVVVALRMEKAGIEREIARGIFEGRSIAELVSAIRPAAPIPAPAPPPESPTTAGKGDAPPVVAEPAPKPAPAAKTSLAALNEASNFLRGIVILAMISSHWIPVYLLSASPDVRRLARFAHPFFSMGSPTLAVVFGLGVSLFYRRQAARNPEAFRGNVRTGVLLLGGGMVLYALAETASFAARHEPIGTRELVLSLYGPLVYYAVATASVPLWVGQVKEDAWTIPKFSYAALALYTAYVVLQKLLPAHHADPFAEFTLRLLIGKWGLLQMGALSAAGVALGLGVERRLERDPDLGQFLHPGLLLAGLGVLLSLAAGQVRLWLVFPKNSDLWSIVTYTGILVALIGLYGRHARRLATDSPFRRPFELVCCLGVLLFPLFVLQSLVYHVSVIVKTWTGLSHTMAISLCIAVVIAVAFGPIRRVHKLYYG